MILVGGLAVAVSIVVLVILLNSVIYAQNVATRSTDAGDQDALEFRATMSDAAADLLDAENERPHPDRGALAADLDEGLGNLSDALRAQWAASLVAVDLRDHVLHNGTRVVQDNATRDLTNASGGANWTVVTGAAGIRSFVLTPTDVEGELLSLDPTDGATRVEVTGANGSVWRLYVYAESATGDTHLAVKNGSSGTVTDPACGGGNWTGDRIDLVGGTVGGTPCAALDFAAGTDGPWTVNVTLGNHTAGNYSLVANTTSVGDLRGPTATASPRWEPYVYEAALNLSVRSPALTYGTRIRVAPGEDRA